jgi:hypothetical protein
MNLRLSILVQSAYVFNNDIFTPSLLKKTITYTDHISTPGDPTNFAIPARERYIQI